MLEAAKRIISEALFGPNPFNDDVRKSIADIARPAIRPTHPLLTAAIKDLEELKLRVSALNESDQTPKPLKINNAFALGPATSGYRTTTGQEFSGINNSIFNQDLMIPPAYSISDKPFDYPCVGLNFKAYLTQTGL